MYITRIQLKDIRGFHTLNLPIAAVDGRPRMRTLIVGRNGTCKSTLLRCIAVALCDEADGNALLAEPIGALITDGKPSGAIEIDLMPRKQPGTRATTTITTWLKRQGDKDIVAKREERETSPPTEKLFVCGYGASRATEGPESGRPYRILDSVYTLFQYGESLHGVELTLRRLRDYLGTERYTRTLKGITKALGLSPRDKIDLPKGGGVVVSGPTIGGKIPLEAWADGYRLTFQWIIDLYAWAMRAGQVTASGGVAGILLVDELEQHLHPSMQTALLGRLSRLLEETQVFATTHSPLVVLGAQPKEVVVLRRKRKSVRADKHIPDFTGFSAEDVLADEDLFDSAVYSPELNQRLEQYRRLASLPKAKRTQAQRRKLQRLAEELRSQQLIPGDESPLLKEVRRLRKDLDL